MNIITAGQGLNCYKECVLGDQSGESSLPVGMTKESLILEKAFELGSEKFAPPPLNLWRKKQCCKDWGIREKKISAEEISVCSDLKWKKKND